MPVLSPEQMAALLQNTPLPRGVHRTMVQIALAESGGRTDARHVNSNGTTDYGLWQINSVHREFDPVRLLADPQYNADAAAKIYEREGFRAWSAYNDGRFRAYADEVEAIPGYGDEVSALDILTGQAGNPVADIARVFAQLVTFVGRAAAWMVHPDNWLRVAKVVVGGALVAGGLYIAVRPAVKG